MTIHIYEGNADNPGDDNQGPRANAAMTEHGFNAVNRGVYIADNLEFLRSLNDECVDLVCIDPPFAKNETFGRKKANSPDPLKPPLTADERQIELDLMARWGIHNPDEATAAGINWPETRYKDFWSWEDDIHEEWLTAIEEDYPDVAKLIDVTRGIRGDDIAAYLCYMAVRLFEIKRVLKDTGSFYLHCDHTAGAYLRQLLDAIFGKANFRREIVWDLRTASGYKSKVDGFIRSHDTILYYAKDAGQFVFQKEFQPHKPQYIARFRKEDPDGRKYRDDRQGRKQYLDETKGVPFTDVWSDIMSFQQNSSSPERTGYPTQKPAALAERIIKASCPEGGVVLDCFAGCAYVAVAAERLGRNWVACDINPRAWTVFKRQFAKPSLALLSCVEPMPGQTVMIGNEATVHGQRLSPGPSSSHSRNAPSKFRPASSRNGKCWSSFSAYPTIRLGAVASPTANRTAPLSGPRATFTLTTSIPNRRMVPTRSSTGRRYAHITTSAKTTGRWPCGSTGWKSPTPAR